MTDFDAIAKGMTQAVPFAGHLGVEVTSIAEGEAAVAPARARRATNHVGSQHAGALFTVAETASGAAFVGAFAERMGEVTPLARSAEIAYEKIAKGPIEARATLGMPKDEALATLDSEGKVEFPCEVVLTDAEGTQVATRHRPLARPAQQAGRRLATLPNP